MKKIVSLAMAFAVILGTLILPACAATFTDVATNHWAFNEINLLTERGVVNGMGDDSFAPDSFVTREQFIKLLVLSCGINMFDMDYFIDNQTRNRQIPLFDDVTLESGGIEWRWSAPYVYTAVMNGIIKYSDYTPIHDAKDYGEQDLFYFNPNQPLTRDEASRYMTRALELSGGDSLSFKDNERIVYKDDVSKAFQAGLLRGFEDNTFRPQNNTTRAEMSVIMVRILNYVQNNPIVVKSFEKNFCNITKVDVSDPNGIKVYANIITPYIISNSEWNNMQNGATLEVNGESYTVGDYETIAKGLYDENGQFAIVVREFDEKNYVLRVYAGGEPIVYKTITENVSFTLSDNFSYFSEDNEAGQRWFKYYDKDAFVESYGNLEECNLSVLLQIVDGEVLYAYDI